MKTPELYEFEMKIRRDERKEICKIFNVKDLDELAVRKWWMWW